MSGKPAMTSRQRVTAAINHQEPDRMPIDVGMYTATGISAFAYWNLREHLGLPVESVELVDGVQVLARIDEDILKLFHSDCVFLKPQAENYWLWNPRGKYQFKVPDYYQPAINSKGEWVITRGEKSMRMPEGGYFFDGDWLNMEANWQEPHFSALAREAERLYKETDYFVTFRAFHPYFEADIDYFCDMITDPERLIEQNATILKSQLENAAKFIDTMGRYVGAVSMSGDLGSQAGPMLRPETFEQVSAPFLKQFCKFMHQNSDCKVFLHCCGAIEPLLPILIDCGIDIINPVQVSAAGMDPQTLKDKYGKDITFWGGGVDTQRVLNMKQPHEVAENVKHLTDIFKPGGGYVFSPVHNIVGDISPENIVAVYEAAYGNSLYRSK